MWSGLGGDSGEGGDLFFLGRGQHLLAKIRKPRLPKSHEILMFVCRQKDAKQIETMLQRKPSYSVCMTYTHCSQRKPEQPVQQWHSCGRVGGRERFGGHWVMPP